MEKKCLFKIGDRVKTDYHIDEKKIVRTVTDIFKSENFGSGYGLYTDGGKPCEKCGSKGKVMNVVDSSWFKKVFSKEITTDTFSFTGTAKDLENGHTGLWTDGVLINCDNERHMAYTFIAGKKYKVTIEEIKE